MENNKDRYHQIYQEALKAYPLKKSQQFKGKHDISGTLTKRRRNNVSRLPFLKIL